MKNKFRITLTACLISLYANAQENEEKNTFLHDFFNKNIEYQAQAQISIGGATPIGIPAQIREIESFKPKKILGIGLNATKWINDQQKYGIRVGVKFEGRGMKTQARVKNYYTQIEDDSGAQTKGYFTGHVITSMENNYLSLPLSFVWNATEKWNFYGGFFFSLAVDKSFSGEIYDGAFREGTPIGELTTFEGTAKGLYDFSDDLRDFLWGNQIGAEYKTNSNWRVFADFTMANTPVFGKNFEAISFKMHNLFANIGVGYHF